MPKLLRQTPGGVGQYFDGQIDDPGRILVREVHSSTCNHCGRLTEFPNHKVMMEYVEICRGCMKLICLHCFGKPCVPQEMECERIEREDRIKKKVEQGSWGCY